MGCSLEASSELALKKSQQTREGRKQTVIEIFVLQGTCARKNRSQTQKLAESEARNKTDRRNSFFESFFDKVFDPFQIFFGYSFLIDQP